MANNIHTLHQDPNVAKLKHFFQKFSKPLTIIIVLGALAWAGWHYWQYRQRQNNLSAATSYQVMSIIAQRHPNSPFLTAKAKSLINQYPKTIYANFAEFMLAKQAIEKKSYSDAIQAFNTVIKTARNPNIKATAKVRLARVYLNIQKPKAAIKTLNTLNQKAYLLLKHILLSQAYLAEKQFVSAKKYLTQALKVTKQDPALQQIHKMLTLRMANLNSLNS